MLFGILILAATAISAPLPDATTKKTTEIRTENLDLNEVNETNFVSKFIKTLKTLMDYFNEHLPDGDLTHLKCEIIANEKEGAFIFQDIDGKIYPHKIPSYSDKNEKKNGIRKYVQINFVENEADSYGTIYFFPHSGNNSSDKENNIFINVHIKNKEKISEIKTLNISKITGHSKVIDATNKNQPERSSTMPTTTDQEDIVTNQVSTFIINFSNLNNKSQVNKNPVYSLNQVNLTEGYYSQDLNVNTSLADTTSNMDKNSQFTVDYYNKMYSVTDISPHSDFTENNLSYSDSIVASPTQENVSGFTTVETSMANENAYSKSFSDPASIKLYTTDTNQIMFTTEMPISKPFITTEFYNTSSTRNSGFSDNNYQKEKNESNKDVNITDSNTHTESPAFHQSTLVQQHLTLNKDIKNITDEESTKSVEIMLNLDNKTYSRIDKDFQNADTKLTTDHNELTEYTTTAEDSESAYSGLETNIIPNKTVKEKVYTTFETTTPSPELSTTYNTYFAGESYTFEFSSIPILIRNTSEPVTLANHSVKMSFIPDNFTINQHSTAVPNDSTDSDEIISTSLVTSDLKKIKNNMTKNPESEHKMNKTNNSVKSLKESLNTNSSKGTVKYIPFNHTGQTSSHDKLFTESIWGSEKNMSASIESATATSNLPFSMVSISTTDRDEIDDTKTISTNSVNSGQLNSESINQVQTISSEKTLSNDKLEMHWASTGASNYTHQSGNDSTFNFTVGSETENTQSLDNLTLSSSRTTEGISTPTSLSLKSYNSVTTQVSSHVTENRFFGDIKDKYLSSTTDNINLNGENPKSELESKYPFSIVDGTTNHENEDYHYSEKYNNGEKPLPPTLKSSEEKFSSNELMKSTQSYNLEEGSNEQEYYFIEQTLSSSTTSSPSSMVSSKTVFSSNINNGYAIKKTTQGEQYSESLKYKSYSENLNTEVSHVTFSPSYSISKNLAFDSEEKSVEVEKSTDNIALISKVVPFYSLSVNTENSVEFSSERTIVGIEKNDKDNQFPKLSTTFSTSKDLNRKGKALITPVPIVSEPTKGQYNGKELTTYNARSSHSDSSLINLPLINGSAETNTYQAPKESTNEWNTNTGYKVTENNSFGTNNGITVPLFPFTSSEPILEELSTTTVSNNSTSDIGQYSVSHNRKPDLIYDEMPIVIASTNNSEREYQNDTVITEQVMNETSESNIELSTITYSSNFSQISSTFVNISDRNIYKENEDQNNSTDPIALQDGTSTIQYEASGFNNFTFSLPTTEHLTAYVPLRLYTIKPISEIK